MVSAEQLQFVLPERTDEKTPTHILGADEDTLCSDLSPGSAMMSMLEKEISAVAKIEARSC